MTFAIPFPAAMLQALADPSVRRIRISIGSGGDAVHLHPIVVSCQATADYQTWTLQIKNDGTFVEGLYASLAATVAFSHDNETWATLFTGQVSPGGLKRTVGLTTDDRVSLELVDITRTKGVRRTMPDTVFTQTPVSDPAHPAQSVLHTLASAMGAAQLDCAPIVHAVSLARTGDGTAWSELKLLRDAYGAVMYFDHLGRLRFRSFQETGWTEPESEWTFVADPAHALDARSSRVLGRIQFDYNSQVCTRAVSEVARYEHRSQRTVYRDTTDWNADLEQCSILIPAGESWPSEGVASLAYQDPDTGEEYPHATDVQTPTIGQNTQYDICHAGGILSLETFEPEAQPGACRIVLRNTGTGLCTVTKLTLRGEPFALVSQATVEESDASVTDETDHVQVDVDGTYAASSEQIDAVLARMVAQGRIRGRHLEFQVPFLPLAQRAMVCTVVLPGGESLLCALASYAHSCQGPTLASMRTSVVLDELSEYEPIAHPVVVSMPRVSAVARKGDPGPQGLQGEAYVVVIESSNGDVFKPGEAMHTTLRARVFLNGAEVTQTIPDSVFSWRRKSFYEPNDDALWNSNHTAGYRTIDVTADSVNGRATYFCDIVQ
jgi:hypothetical protein